MIRFIALIFLALAMQTAAAQENDKKEVCIGFRVGSSLLDPKFGNNEANLNDVIQFLNEVRNDTTIELTQVKFCGSASPEGGSKLNRKLAKRRCANMEQYVRQRIMLPEENFVWYLPAKDEYSEVKDNTYPLNGYYWTSTASDIEGDDEKAYQYKEGEGTSLSRRTNKLHIRAVRKK